MQPECWAELGGLSRLQRLRVGWCQIFTGAQQSALESSLNSLPQLSELSVYLWSHRNVEGLPLSLRLAALCVPACRRSPFCSTARGSSASHWCHAPR